MHNFFDEGWRGAGFKLKNIMVTLLKLTASFKSMVLGTNIGDILTVSTWVQSAFFGVVEETKRLQWHDVHVHFFYFRRTVGCPPPLELFSFVACIPTECFLAFDDRLSLSY